MVHRFKVGEKYSGEIIYGGCGQMDRNWVIIRKRTKSYIIYEDKFGRQTKAPREYEGGWGEFVTVGEDAFFAYSIEPY